MLLDTHVVIWSIMDSPRLGEQAWNLIAARSQTDPFYVNAFAAWEIAMLVKKGRLNLGRPAQEWLVEAEKHPAW